MDVCDSREETLWKQNHFTQFDYMHMICAYCSKTFRSLSQVDNHMIDIHLKEIPKVNGKKTLLCYKRIYVPELRCYCLRSFFCEP